MRVFLLVSLWVICPFTVVCTTSQTLLADQSPPVSNPSFQEWLINKIDSDPTAWDNIRKLVQPIQKRLAYDTHQKEIVILPNEIPEVALKAMSAEAGQDPKLKPFVGSPTESPRLRPYLSSGGMWNWITLSPFLPGHYDVTMEVLTEQNMHWTFKTQAAEVVADASRDPDLFEWKCPPAHAQNPLNSSTSPANGFIRGKYHFYKWLKDRLGDIHKAQEIGDNRLALYQLGRALHSIQDLASHRGMDNAEHSWLDRRGEGPDEDRYINIPLAKTLTRDFLVEVVANWPLINYPHLRNPTGALTPWGYKEIKIRLGFSKQLNWEEYSLYKKLGENLPLSLKGFSGLDLDAAILKLKNRWFVANEWRNLMTDLKKNLFKAEQLDSIIVHCPTL